MKFDFATTGRTFILVGLSVGSVVGALIRQLRTSIRLVQPPAVESDRVEFLLGDLYAFNVHQLKPHTRS